MIGNILDNTTELYLIKYTFGEIFSSGGATLYKNPSDHTVIGLIYAYLSYTNFPLSQKSCISRTPSPSLGRLLQNVSYLFSKFYFLCSSLRLYCSEWRTNAVLEYLIFIHIPKLADIFFNNVVRSCLEKIKTFLSSFALGVLFHINSDKREKTVIGVLLSLVFFGS